MDRELLEKIKSTIEDQIKYGPSESAMVRLLKMVEELESK